VFRLVLLPAELLRKCGSERRRSRWPITIAPGMVEAAVVAADSRPPVVPATHRADSEVDA